MKRIAGLALVLMPMVVAAQTIYRWTDASGEVHYTDNLSTVPRRAKVATTDGTPINTVQGEAPQPVVQRKAVEPEPKKKKPDEDDPWVIKEKLPTGPPEVTITGVHADVAENDLDFIRACVNQGAKSPALLRFGALHGPISVTIETSAKMSDHAFGEAEGYTTMRLRTPREVMLMNGLPLPYEATVTHELAHLLEHQAAGLKRPRWFAEGFASYVGNNNKYFTPYDVAYWVVTYGGEHPFDRVFSRWCNPFLSYQISQELIAFLIELVGDEGIRRMFELRRKGQSFEKSFESVSGLTIDAFEAKYVASVRPNFYERAH